MKGFEQAAALDPTNADYRLAADVARSHAVTALIQAAAKDRLLGNEAAARAALARALALDPTNSKPTSISTNWPTTPARASRKPLYEQSSSEIGWPQSRLSLPPAAQLPSARRSSAGDQQVFKAYGLRRCSTTACARLVRLDVDDASFEEAARVLGMVTEYVLCPAGRAPRAGGRRHARRTAAVYCAGLETVYLAGLSDDELTEVETLAKNVFHRAAGQRRSIRRAHHHPARAASALWNAFNATMREPAGRAQPGAAGRAPDPGGAHQRPQHRRAVAADHRGLQRVCRGTIDPEREPEPGAADHFVGTGSAQRSPGDSGHTARLGPGFELAALERIRLVWRRAYGVGTGAGIDHVQPQPEHVGLARAGSDSAAPGGRRGGNAQGGRTISHPDLVLFEPVAQRRRIFRG